MRLDQPFPDRLRILPSEVPVFLNFIESIPDWGAFHYITDMSDGMTMFIVRLYNEFPDSAFDLGVNRIFQVNHHFLKLIVDWCEEQNPEIGGTGRLIMTPEESKEVLYEGFRQGLLNDGFKLDIPTWAEAKALRDAPIPDPAELYSGSEEPAKLSSDWWETFPEELSK